MSKREIASLACKILGIYVIVQGVNVLSSILYVSVATSVATSNPILNVVNETLVNIIFSFTYIIVGALLWFLSDKLSSWMVTKENESVVKSSGIEVNDIQRVSFSVLGLYFLGGSLPRLVSTLLSIYSMRDMTPSATGYILRSSVEAIGEFIIGLVLFLGSQGLVNFLNSMRTAGLKRKDDQIE